MKTLTVIFAAAMLISTSANAQTKVEPSAEQATKPMKSSPEHSCLMETDLAAWKTLGLNDDQLTKVQVIQTTCKKECEAAKASALDEKAAMEHTASMERHTAELKEVLTPEQHTKWVDWCSDRTKRSELKD